ncbi:MAG: hypothetical protein A2428_10765 [Bdellovibrionales bacterium RIFOXYC1_FULL_54_43]|nr:MAG: hypothetical protein A2428_10765 [Bdellovibrionales bacterium RIFOXYC1_FULL_54_43]OFZ78357.1 MAG: hypothetical protein A2603_12530 [Bdellovibrionales bacterium RIFOXYD1_FULL_55_31]
MIRFSAILLVATILIPFSSSFAAESSLRFVPKPEDLDSDERKVKSPGNLSVMYGGKSRMIYVSNQTYTYTLSKQNRGSFQIAFTNSQTGANAYSHSAIHAFFFFPRVDDPFFEILDNGDVLLMTPSGHNVTISKNTGKILSVSGATISRSAPTLQNAGGTTIARLEDGLLLDCGSAIGDKARYLTPGSCTFIDSRDTKCKVANTELFKKLDKWNARFNKTDEELAVFLKTNCPKLDITSLANPQSRRRSRTTDDLDPDKYLEKRFIELETEVNRKRNSPGAAVAE